jgi:ribose 5-phosphate isomerase B
MRIMIGFDHRGRALAGRIGEWLAGRGITSETTGPAEGESGDYPAAAAVVGRAVASGRSDRGILICNSGVGMCIAANKIAGIRAALAVNPTMAEHSRRHNDSNVLCLGAVNQPDDVALASVAAWLDAPFEGGRHARRVEMIRKLEGGGEL